jgi:hypothetical protein
MHVKVIDGLVCVWTLVDHEAIPGGVQAAALRDLTCRESETANKCRPRFIVVHDELDVLGRDHNYVSCRDGLYILERHNVIVTMQDVGGQFTCHNLAKDADGVSGHYRPICAAMICRW